MKNKTTNHDYKNFLEYKIQDRKDKIFLSLEKEFLNYLSVGKIVNANLYDENKKNFTNFFTRILKNVFFSSLYKKLSTGFITKLNSFQKKSFQTFENKTFKKVVIISDKKVQRTDPGIEEFSNMVTREWNANLYFRAMPQHDKNWLETNIVSEINRELFEKSITNVLKKFPKGELQNKYSDLNKISDSQLNKLWTKFIDTRVWYSYERYIKAYELLGDQEIISKLNDIYSLINDETLMIIYNNGDDENTFFDYLFNFENELFNYINDKKNLSILVISKNNAYKNTFLGLLSIGNVENISEINDLSFDYDNVDDTIDFSEYNLDSEVNDNTIEMFSDKKSITKKKTSAPKKPRAKTKVKKNITDLTKTISVDDYGDSGTLEKFISDNSEIISTKKTFDADKKTLDDTESDLLKPISDDVNIISRQIIEAANEIEDSPIKNNFVASTKNNFEKDRTVTTIDFGMLDEENDFENDPEEKIEYIAKDISKEDVAKKLIYSEKENENETNDDFIDTIVVDSFVEPKKETASNISIENIVSNSNRESLLNYIKYRTTFKLFISIFKHIKDSNDKIFFDSDATSMSFENKIKSYDIERTYNFIKKTMPVMIEVLYSNNIKPSEVNRCFVVFNHVVNKFSEVNELIDLLMN